jgi:hypothetical protein
MVGRDLSGAAGAEDRRAVETVSMAAGDSLGLSTISRQSAKQSSGKRKAVLGAAFPLLTGRPATGP